MSRLLNVFLLSELHGPNVPFLSSVRAITDIRVDAYETTSTAPTIIDEEEGDVGTYLSDVDLDLQDAGNNDDGDSGGHAQWLEDPRNTSPEDCIMSDYQ